MIITAFNPDTSDLEKTYISSFQAAGVTTLPVKNNNMFINTYPILIGRMGDERSELNICGGITGKTQITVSATNFDHNSDDPVYVLFFNKIKFYRSDTLTGAKTLKVTLDIDVDNEEKVTRWDDTTALASYYYYVTYYNSVTNEETDYSDPMQPGGYGVVTAGNIIDQVVRRVRDTSYTVLGTNEYLDIMNEVGSDLITQAHRPYKFLKRTVTLDTTANQNYLTFPTNFWKLEYVEVLTAAGTYRRYSRDDLMNLQEFNNRYNNNQLQPQDNILQMALDEAANTLLVYPTPKTSVTGSVILHYYKTFDTINSVGDAVETPNNLIYRYKLMAEYYSAKSEADKQWFNLGTKYEGKYAAEIGKMQRVNRVETGPQSIAPPPGSIRRRRFHL